MNCEQDFNNKSLPVILKAVPDELLSSWLYRHAVFYGVTERLLIDWLALETPTLRALDNKLNLRHVARLGDMLHADPTIVVSMTYTQLPVEASRIAGKRKGQQLCRSCFDRNSENGASGAVLKNWGEAWRVTCRLCGSPFCETHETSGGWEALRETSVFADLWDRATAGETLVDRHIRGEKTTVGSPIALMRLLLLPKPWKPQRATDEYRAGWLLNELVPCFDNCARPIKRRVNEGAIGTLPVFLRIPLLAGVAILADSSAAAIENLRKLIRPCTARRFDMLAATALGSRQIFSN
jgi:hypothetical protein